MTRWHSIIQPSCLPLSLVMLFIHQSPRGLLLCKRLPAPPRPMCHPRISRRRYQPCLIRYPRLHRPLHLIIDFHNHPLRPELPVLLLILALHNRERLHNIVHVIALDAIQVKISRVQLAAQQETPLFVPSEGRTIVATVFSEGFQVPGGIGEFEGARPDPIGQRYPIVPFTFINVLSWQKYWKLLQNEECHVSTTKFLPGNIVENKGRSTASKVCNFTSIFGVKHYDRKRMTTRDCWKDTEYCRANVR